MPELQSQPYFRNQTNHDYETQLAGRIKTEEITEESIYDAMTRLVKPASTAPEAVSMPTRIEEIQYERSRKELIRISMRLVILDKDFKPALTREGSITDGMWKLNNPIELNNARPIKIGFLLPIPPDDIFDDNFTVESFNIKENIYA